MPKKTKSTKQTKAKTKKSKKSSSKKKDLAPVEEPTVQETVEETTVVEVAPEEDSVTESEEVVSEETPQVQKTEVTVPTLFEQVSVLCDDMKAWQSAGRVLMKRLTDFRRDVQKLEKALDKAQNSKKSTRKRNVNHQSGIMQPHKVSAKLNKFMKHVLDGDDVKETYSRVDVLKAISKYVKAQKLQDTDNARYINLDKHLEAIFPNLKGSEGTDRLQFTSVMKNISQHFPTAKSKQASKE